MTDFILTALWIAGSIIAVTVAIMLVAMGIYVLFVRRFARDDDESSSPPGDASLLNHPDLPAPRKRERREPEPMGA